MMPDIDLASAHAAAERLRRSFSDRPMRMPRSASARLEAGDRVDRRGGAGTGRPAVSHLLRRADRAMYAAKAAGRNRVMVDVLGA